jgi:iron-sulfur cluster repair protein YtfE (RIC family)
MEEAQMNPDALELLLRNHESIRDRFREIHLTDDIAERITLFGRVKRELDTHMRIEEEVFYPAVAPLGRFDRQIEGSLEDHQEVRDRIADIEEDSEPDDIDLDLEDLIEAVEAHLEQEEEEFFPQVRDLMSESELLNLGARLLDARIDPGTRGSAAA